MKVCTWTILAIGVSGALALTSGAQAHQGHRQQSQAFQSTPQKNPKAQMAAGGKSAMPIQPIRQTRSAAEVEKPSRFCMANRDGKVHCIPFGGE